MAEVTRISNESKRPLVWNGLWADVEHAIQELDWYASRKKNLSEGTGQPGEIWADYLAEALRELRGAIDAARRAVRKVI